MNRNAEISEKCKQTARGIMLCMIEKYINKKTHLVVGLTQSKHIQTTFVPFFDEIYKKVLVSGEIFSKLGIHFTFRLGIF